jgi:hypothetical protein
MESAKPAEAGKRGKRKEERGKRKEERGKRINDKRQELR